MATLRLLCIPGAGAGIGAFQGWGSALSERVEVWAVQLPGREDRLRDAPYTAWSALMGDMTDAVRAWPPRPVALFGHSLGAVIALAGCACTAAGSSTCSSRAGRGRVHAVPSGAA